MHILLNASNLGATGPEVLVRSLVRSLAALAPDDRFTLLLPSSKQGECWSLPENCRINYVRRTRPREFGRMWDIYRGLRRICKSLNADICFTLGDIGPIDAYAPHVIYLHQAYLVYPEPFLMKALPWYERARLVYQRWHFGYSVRRAAAVIVQTPVVADRLAGQYLVDRKQVHVIPPILPAHIQSLRAGEASFYAPMLGVSSNLRLLFLATFYAHKNHAVLPALISELRRRGLSDKVHFFLTLDGNRRRAETILLKKLESERQMVTNLGRLNPEHVSQALRSADALFMPTLVETVGLIYLEAMVVGKPILTSERDFARHICGELALYFDPLDPISIADAIELFLKDPLYWKNIVEKRANQRLARFSRSEEENAGAFLHILRQVGSSHRT